MCDLNVQCKNSVVGYTCVWLTGYTDDENTCDDVDGNGFTCECNDGYAGDGYDSATNTGCADIDECTNVDASDKNSCRQLW